MKLEMYLGTFDINELDIPIINNNSFQYSRQHIQQASQQIFYEIIQNSIDNYKNSNCPKDYYIDVILNKRNFTIKNNGRVFNISNDIDRVFSTLNTSTHYTKQTASAGTNGLGAKLVCLTQQVFQIKNQNNNQLYISTWRRIQNEHTHEIQQVQDNNYFQVFVQLLQPNYEVIISNEIKRIYNFADFNIPSILFYLYHIPHLGIKTIFNKTEIPLIQLNDLYKPVQYVRIQLTKDLECHLLQQSLLKHNYTFINGIYCQDSVCFQDIRNQIKQICNLSNTRIDYNIVIIGYQAGITYAEQTKTKMTTKFKIPQSEYDKIKIFISNILSHKIIKKKDIHIAKYSAANFSTKSNSNCSLILTEGDSAKTLFDRIAEYSPNNFYDYHGVFALRGKLLNTYTYKNPFEIQNEEIQNLIKIIGFQPGVKYSRENIKNLRYQSIIIASDYDDDGYHIKGLILNFFIRFWPELLSLNYFKQFTTPRILADEVEYYQDIDFNKTQRHREVQYLKGLGTINPKSNLFKNIAQHFDKYLRELTTTDIQQTMQLLNNLFNTDSQPRKEMMNSFEYQGIDHTQDYIPINIILNQQVLLYAQSSVQRAIPNFMDGLKESQRKIIYHAYKHPTTKQTKQKVANYASIISHTYDYHHGEVSLQGAIIKLAQDFAGTNNCPLLEPDGQFGSRWNPSNTASPRYIFTYTSDFTKKIFKKEDEELYTFNLSDEGEPIEPKFMLPIIPIFMVNSVLGIATGFSTKIPNFKLKDIKEYIIHYLNNQTPVLLQPYYNNYLGETSIEYGLFINKGLIKQDSTNLYIYDTILSKCKEDLLNDLEEKGVFPQREGQDDYLKIPLKKITKEIQEIIDKYTQESYKLQNMTLVKNDNKVIQYNNIYKLLDNWIDQRLYYYIKRKQNILRNIIKDFIIKYNYQQMIDRQIIDTYKQKDIFYNKIKYLTPFSKIQQYSQGLLKIDQIQNIIKQLGEDMTQQQTDDIKEYKYLTDKSINFYVQKDFHLDEIIKQYQTTYMLQEKDMWINDLQQL